MVGSGGRGEEVAVFPRGPLHELTFCSLAVLSFTAVSPFAMQIGTESSKLRLRNKNRPTYFVGEVRSHFY